MPVALQTPPPFKGGSAAGRFGTGFIWIAPPDSFRTCLNSGAVRGIPETDLRQHYSGLCAGLFFHPNTGTQASPVPFLCQVRYIIEHLCRFQPVPTGAPLVRPGRQRTKCLFRKPLAFAAPHTLGKRISTSHYDAHRPFACAANLIATPVR